MSWPKSAAAKDIDIDIADISGHKIRYCIDIGKCDIDPLLLLTSAFRVFILILRSTNVLNDNNKKSK